MIILLVFQVILLLVLLNESNENCDPDLSKVSFPFAESIGGAAAFVDLLRSVITNILQFFYITLIM